MHGADLLLVTVVAVSIIVGLVRGFVREAVSLITWLVAIWLAWRHSDFLHPWLGGSLESPEAKAWAARAIMLVGVLLIGNVLGALAAWITHTAAGLSVVDRLIGMLFGFIRAAVLIGLAVIVGTSVQLDREAWWQKATLRPYAEYVAEWLESYSGHTRQAAAEALEKLDEAAERQKARLRAQEAKER